MQEGIVKFVLATTQHVILSNSRSVDAEMAKGVTNLVDWCRSRRFAVFQQIDPNLRHASMHRDYSLAANLITLRLLDPPPSGPVQLVPTEFANIALATVEGATACWLGSVLALATVGCDPRDAGLHDLVSTEEAITLALLLGGWSVTELNISEREVRIAASGTRKPTLTDMVTVLPYLDETVTSLAILVRNGVDVRFSIPVQVTREALDAPPEDGGVEFVTSQRMTTIDGEPVATEATVRKIYAIAATDAFLNMPKGAGRRRIVALWKKAKALGDAELTSQLKIMLDHLTFGVEYVGGKAPTNLIKWARRRTE
jgi:hypothetical protein